MRLIILLTFGITYNNIVLTFYLLILSSILRLNRISNLFYRNDLFLIKTNHFYCVDNKLIIAGINIRGDRKFYVCLL